MGRILMVENDQTCGTGRGQKTDAQNCGWNANMESQKYAVDPQHKNRVWLRPEGFKLKF